MPPQGSAGRGGRSGGRGNNNNNNNNAGRHGGRGHGGRSGGRSNGRGHNNNNNNKKKKKDGPIVECGSCHTTSPAHGVQIYDSNSFQRGSGSGPLPLKLCTHCRRAAFCCKKCEFTHACWQKRKAKEEKTKKEQAARKEKELLAAAEAAEAAKKAQKEAQEEAKKAEMAAAEAAMEEKWAALAAEQARASQQQDSNNNITVATEKVPPKRATAASRFQRQHQETVNESSAKPAPSQINADVSPRVATRTSAKENSAGAVATPKKKAATPKKVASPKASAYGNLVGAFVSKPKKKKAQAVVARRPKDLPVPITRGRTSLKPGPLSTEMFLDVLNQDDVVLHMDPRRFPLEADSPFHDFMGVYEVCYMESDGLPDLTLSEEKTELLCRKFRACSPKARRCLTQERGIHIERRKRNKHCPQMGRYAQSEPDTWVVTTFEDNSLYLSGYGVLLFRDRDIWTDSAALFERSDEFFTPWLACKAMQRESSQIAVAMTPLKTFLKALEMAEIPERLRLPEMKASDFSFWNKIMVVHADVQKCTSSIENLSAWMGVYVPTGRTFDGYPLWQRSRQKSNALVSSSVTDEKNKRNLGALGIDLNWDCDEKSAYLYMYRHALHIASVEGFNASPSRDFSLRGASAPPNEVKLLTQSDALFQIGRDACTTWTFIDNNKWQTVCVAVTPELFFWNTIDLVDVDQGFGDEDDSKEFQTAATGKKKQKKKKKKKKKHNISESENNPSSHGDAELPAPILNSESPVIQREGLAAQECEAAGSTEAGEEATVIDTKTTSESGVNIDEARCGFARAQAARLVKDLGLESKSTAESTSEDTSEQSPTTSEALQDFFNLKVREPYFLLVDEKLSSSIFTGSLAAQSSTVFESTKEWMRFCADDLLTTCVARGWLSFSVSLLRAGITISAHNLASVFDTLPMENNESNNMIAKAVQSIKLSSNSEYSSLLSAVTRRVGKNTRKEFTIVLKAAQGVLREKELAQRQMNPSHEEPRNRRAIGKPGLMVRASKQVNEGRKNSLDVTPSEQNTEIEGFQKRIEAALEWYKNQLSQSQACSDLEERVTAENEAIQKKRGSPEKTCEIVDSGDRGTFCVTDAPKTLLLSSKEVAAELAKCVHLPEKQQEEKVYDIERNIDLSDFEDTEWTIEMTEHAHKWFRKHSKREHHLCDRVIRRLKILSTGRWTYVLCKPVRTSKSSINLYESKIDKGCRILWEVAVAFSPRRSKDSHSFCEQVIRVWDIVLDHDKLDREIDRAVERVEKSHLRGQGCVLYSELEDFDNCSDAPGSVVGQQVPRVFAMREDLTSNNSVDSAKESEKCRHYPPASDDPRQFTLLKFYELDAGAIDCLLHSKNQNTDLPFTPGPKEHAIIHYTSTPPRSILLMGRSGTGKTTCLVFRMWAQYMAYEAKGVKPQQLFVTKNDVLRQEVEKSFQNMGLAWRKKNPSSENTGSSVDKGAPVSDNCSESSPGVSTPLFLTSHEWLEILDAELPGDRFFTPIEVEERIGFRNEDDAVMRGVEALFAEDEKLGNTKGKGATRQEMTYSLFHKKWPKINSRTKSDMNPALVWREIKSYIKGSVSALHVDDPERSLPHRRFLDLNEYLALPRKVSRLDQAQRRVAYALYERYEKIKAEGNHFDEMDVVYNLAGRVSLFCTTARTAEDGENKPRQGILPIDSLFVDEVQDFTQAELYLLVKLSADPNNLMLAGDTAQSISIGVGFRFADVRQIFFKEFGGNEPQLLQLIYNYRSHSGVLRLAASVVELLYFFFSDSLDRLPPDLGLFKGPKPVIMEANTPDELVLMLEGSKRETSRIEFGAHQVVIVRSEEAKAALPDEFGVDKDWVMTVQEAKGLEFDDVLLYDFFSDSKAGDLWRVASSYTAKDCAEYFEHVSVKASGVQSYEWDDLVEAKSRKLDFDDTQHKILETELKMLYTAITRARVNVFIAESDAELSRPMFEYFKKRQVVEVSNSKESNDMSGVRVFGKLSSIDDYRQRGEYYLQHAEGGRRKGCLRLAAKCFEKAGEMKRRDFALAYLSFIEIDEKEAPTGRRRDKQVAFRRERLYKIAVQLLEARDLVFLDKAAFCLLQTGDAELARSAQMFELYAEISCARRGRSNESQPSNQEQRYFAYAAKFYERAASSQHLSLAERRELLIQSFRDYLCSGKSEELQSAALLLETNSHVLQKTFKELAAVYKSSEENPKDPISYFMKHLKRMQVAECVELSVQKLARVACRSYFSADDADGLLAALASIPLAEKTQMLRSLDTDPFDYVMASPWGSHPVFSKLRSATQKGSPTRGAKRIDVAAMLVEVHTSSQQEEKAVDILEERGLLLDAAECLLRLASSTTSASTQKEYMRKSAELKVRYLDLVLRCKHWEKRRTELRKILDEAVQSVDSFSEAVSLSAVMCDVKLGGSSIDIWEAFRRCDNSVLWKYDFISMFVSGPSGFHGLLSQRPDSDYWGSARFVVQVTQELEQTAATLLAIASSRRPQDTAVIAHVESYFELKRHSFDPSQLVTTCATNLRLRIALFENKDLLESSSTRSLQLPLPRDTLHRILAKDLYRKAAQLLLSLEKHLSEQTTKTRPCPSVLFGTKCREKKPCKNSHSALSQACQENVSMLQCHLVSMEQIRSLRRNIDLKFPRWSLGPRLKERCSYKSSYELVDYLLNTNSGPFEIVEDAYHDDGRSLGKRFVWRKSTLKALTQNERHRWRQLARYKKKEDVMELVRYWRILHFCDDSTSSTRKIETELQFIERNELIVKQDLAKKNTDHFIDATVSMKDLKLVSNFWIWSIDSAKDDLLQSVKSIENLLTRTSSLKGLTSFSKMDQLSLMEANAVGIFSALSLRYSNASKPTQHCYWVIPQGYLSCYLEESVMSRARGFGMPLKDALQGTCDKHFFHFFSNFVCRLEHLADMIVQGGLLRLPNQYKLEDLGQFERAVCLAFFVCANSVLFSLAGSNLNCHEAEDEVNELPAVPLCGNIKLLAEQLAVSVVGCKASPRLQKAFMRMKKTSTLHDLLQATDNLIQNSGWCNKLMLCRLRQIKEGVEVETCDETSRVESALRNITLSEGSGVFLRHFKPKCQDFLLRYEQISDAPENSNDLTAMSRKADERNAAMIIFRTLQHWREKKTGKGQSSASHFRTWKVLLARFVNMVKLRMEHILEERRASLGSDLPDMLDVTLCPLNAIPNQINDAGHFQQTLQKWGHHLSEKFSPFFDGIECTFCNMVGNPQAQEMRRHWCHSHHPTVTYNEACLHYNMAHFGSYEAPFVDDYDVLFRQHLYDAFHTQNLATHRSQHQSLTQLAAQMDYAFMNINSVINVCGNQQGHPFAASWYLIIGEEARSFLAILQSAHRGLFEQATSWPPRPDFSVLMGSLNTTIQESYDFVRRVQDTERRKAEDAASREDENHEGVVIGGPTVELVN